MSQDYGTPEDRQDDFSWGPQAVPVQPIFGGDAKCWCGGRVGPREPGDERGLGCLDSVYHDWSATGRPDKILRLYIAGPMTGYPDCNYPAFQEAARVLRAAGYEIVNPADVHIGHNHHYVDLIREDLRVMLDCQGVATLENWWESTGARNEVQVAGILKMPVRTLAEWLERAHVELSR